MESNGTAKEGRRRERQLTPLERLVAVAMADDQELGNVDDGLATECPNLWQWMSVTSAGKNHVMPPATLTLQLVPGGAIATIRHPGLGKTVEASSDTLAGCFMGMEEMLKKTNPPLKNLGKGDPKIRKKRQSS